MNAEKPKIQYCCYCGAELGVYVRMYGERDTCGAPECERRMRDDARAEREEAHRQLDRDRGWK